MPFSFPASPSVGAVSQQNGRSFTYAGNNVWELVAASGGSGSLSGSVTIPGTDPYWDNVLLLLRGDGNFTDSSKYGRTLTAYGNAAANAAGRYGTNSIALDGTGDYLSLSSSDFAWGTSDWTAEAWVWLTAYGTYGSYFSTFFSNGSPYGVSVGVTNTGYPFLMHPGGANIQGASLLPTGQWVHLAAVRASGVVAYYVNGTSVGSVTAADSHGQSNVVVGRTYVELDNNYWNGRIAELRVTKAARYTANFTPPTTALPTTLLQSSPQTLPVTVTGSGGGSGLTWSSVPASATATGTAGSIAYDHANGFFYVATATDSWKRAALSTWSLDPYLSDLLLLMRMDGSAVDISSRAVSFTSPPGAFSTTRKFGSNSYSVNGQTGFTSISKAVPDISTGDWTVEAWVYRQTANDTYANIVFLNAASTASTSGTGGLNIYINQDGSVVENNGLAGALNGGSVAVGAWTHIAVVMSSGVSKLYINGTSVATGSQQPVAGPYWANIGWVQPTSPTFASDLLIDELRITKAARYTANFTPPTTAFSNA